MSNACALLASSSSTRRGTRAPHTAGAPSRPPRTSSTGTTAGDGCASKRATASRPMRRAATTSRCIWMPRRRRSMAGCCKAAAVVMRVSPPPRSPSSIALALVATSWSRNYCSASRTSNSASRAWRSARACASIPSRWAALRTARRDPPSSSHATVAPRSTQPSATSSRPECRRRGRQAVRRRRQLAAWTRAPKFICASATIAAARSRTCPLGCDAAPPSMVRSSRRRSIGSFIRTRRAGSTRRRAF